MAHTTAIEDSGPFHILYSVDEDATAVSAVEARDLLGDLTAQGVGAGSPLYDLLNVSLADQAAARNALEEDVTVTVWTRAALAGAAPAVLTVDADAVSNAFRLNLLVAKAASTTTGTWYVEVRRRHSIIGA